MWQELKIKLNVDPVGLSALLEALKARVTSVLKFEGADFMSSVAAKVIHPKDYKRLKKGAHQSHLGRQKWAGFWQISLYMI